MDFGITIKPDLTIDRIVNLTKQAESAGFRYGWIFDSHVIWMEPFPLLTLMAANTTLMRLGTCVTNPAVRDVTVSASLFATLNVFSHGRMQLGIGRGDSSRRVLGKKPTTLENLEQFVRVFRALNSRHAVELDGVSTRFPWANGGAPPVWVAGYGPKALRTAGRDPAKIEVMAAAPVWASSDLKLARERVRWFPALVSNHVIDLISKYKPEELPQSLVSFVKDRGKYDYLHHCEVGSDNADFVTDEIVDRFCLVGPIEQHRKKLEALRKVGVTQFNIYLMCGEEEKPLDVYAREVLHHYLNAVSISSV